MSVNFGYSLNWSGDEVCFKASLSSYILTVDRDIGKWLYVFVGHGTDPIDRREAQVSFEKQCQTFQATKAQLLLLQEA